VNKTVVSATVETDEAGMRVDRWFKTHYPELAFGHLQKLLRSGQVRVDGGRVKSNTRLETGQVVRVPPMRAGDPRPVNRKPAPGDDAGALRALLLHEDDHLFVFNKPEGLAVQGGSGLSRHVDGMLEALRDRKGQKPRLVHRLDRATSGVLVVARTRLAAQKLAGEFRNRTTRKIYWALVKGIPRQRQGRISTWLVKETGEDGDRMRVTRGRVKDASHAVTMYSVIDQAGQNLAWLSMRPVTGRTHQLRVHAAHMGQPIIGDAKYFNIENWALPGGVQNRLHLHARRLVIPHPAGGVLDVTAPLPQHMQQSWNLFGFDVERGNESQLEEGEE
jgi:23S rRNA pseudouridine955/2504/2580 synthase